MNSVVSMVYSDDYGDGALVYHDLTDETLVSIESTISIGSNIILAVKKNFPYSAQRVVERINRNTKKGSLKIFLNKKIPVIPEILELLDNHSTPDEFKSFLSKDIDDREKQIDQLSKEGMGAVYIFLNSVENYLSSNIEELSHQKAKEIFDILLTSRKYLMHKSSSLKHLLNQLLTVV